jgi:hypothetical protein
MNTKMSRRQELGWTIKYGLMGAGALVGLAALIALVFFGSIFILNHMAYGSQVAVLNLTAIENIQNETCLAAGFTDGQDNPFNQVMLDRCGDTYYQGFLEGCMSANNSKAICDQAADSE